MNPETSITVSVPYYRSLQHIRKCVESLLSQTYEDIIVVVVNDGDVLTPPWSELSHITDARLIRYDLKKNHGPYFIHDLVLKSCQTKYFSVHDSDDSSLPSRLEILTKELLRQGADFAFSSERVFRVLNNNSVFEGTRWRLEENAPVAYQFIVDNRLTSEFKNRASHHALFRKTALLDIGGYFGGYRINYDSLLTNYLLMVGKMAFVDSPLYEYFIRHDSLSNSSETGANSLIRKKVKNDQAMIYRSAFSSYQKFVSGKISGQNLLKKINDLQNLNITQESDLSLKNAIRDLSILLKVS